MLLFLSNMAMSQLVFENGKPDMDKVIYSDSILESFSFDKDLTDSLHKEFYKLPGNSTFALSEEVYFNPLNSGYILHNGSSSVWYLKIRSENARSVNIIFSSFSLAEDEKVFVYNTDHSMVRGPFTDKNNKKGRGMAVAPVTGEEIIIEYHFNGNPDDKRLVVGRIAHDFVGIMEAVDKKDVYYGESQPCNVDINCESGADWQVEKNAVVRVIAGGVELGSGFLVNNTNQENIAYLITANHVIVNPDNAIYSIYFFRYESPYCDGPDGNAGYTLSGAEMMAEDEETDFTIVKLDDFPPVTYKPYLAGWDVSGDVPDSTVCIHHPSGDVKKISTDRDSPVPDTFLELYENGFWRILEWDEGTTEGGSSGSPLFNQDHRAVGFLSGGEAVCGRSVNDYFSRLDISFDLYSEYSRSLLPWLDPARSGVEKLDGRDPYKDNKTDFDTLCNCPVDERHLTEYTAPGKGYTTGFNSDSTIMYAERFYAEPGEKLVEVIMDIGESQLSESGDSISVFVMTGVDEPESVIARKKLFIREARNSSQLFFDFIEPVALPETFFIAWRLWYKGAVTDEIQQFAVFHGGIVEINLNTAFYRDASNWHPFYENPFDPSPVNLCVSIVKTANTVYDGVENTVPGENEMTLYPNPADDIVKIRPDKDVRGKIIYSLHDLTGRTVSKGVLSFDSPFEVRYIDVSFLNPGIYYLNLSGKEYYLTGKIVVR